MQPFVSHLLEAETLDIISINFWHILISLLNLVILFLLVKKFLFKPVRQLFADRQQAIDSRYAAAEEAEREAEASRTAWEEKLEGAQAEADAILQNAADTAKYRAAQIVREASEKAEGILERAEAEAVLTQKKAEDGIKREIVDISAAIAEKMLEREVDTRDHRAMIDSFIGQLGERDGGDQ